MSDLGSSNYKKLTPADGFVINIDNWVNALILNPATSLNSGTINMPPAPDDKQLLSIVSTQQISSITLNASQIVQSPITTLPANMPAQWVFNGPNQTWSPQIVFPQAIANVPMTYNASTLRTGVIEYTNSVITTSGNAVFTMTNGAGAAIFTNIDFIKAEVSDATNSYNYSYTVSTDKKTLTVSVMRSAPTGVISLLGINLLSAPVATPNNTVVNVLVKGN